jgi:hypothetical protein
LKNILFDESGDLGFDFSNPRTTRFFLATFLITSDTRAVSNAVRNTFRSLRKTHKKRTGGLLHCHYEDKITRERLLRSLADCEVSIATMTLDKHKMLLSADPNSLYSSIVLALLNKLFIDNLLDTRESIRFVASQMHTNKLQNTQFISVVKDGAKAVDCKMEVAKPADNKGLQAVDFASWSLWRKQEFGEASYADIVADKVIAEYDYI